MEIIFGQKPHNGKIDVTISLYEENDQFGQSAKVTLKIDDSDSRKQIQSDSRVALKGFLERALSALHDEGHPQ
ncbi:hypothetical protein MAH1_33700 [Sessilibacter sp. MAH1]